MPMVYIQCPITDNLVPTNHILPDIETLKSHTKKVLVECQYCNSLHVWDDKNGFFLGASKKNGKGKSDK
jgi:hypothetical protein